MHPIILVSEDLVKRQSEIEKILDSHKLSKTHPDVLYFETTEKLGIDAAKKIRQFLQIKPLQSKSKFVILESADNLTPDSQNSLLKTLEEPSGDNMIIMGAENLSKLLPTVISRCRIQKLDQDNFTAISDSDGQIEQLMAMDIDGKFEFIEKCPDKNRLLDDLVIFYRNRMLKNPESADLVTELLNAKMWEKQNGNIRAILEYLILVTEKNRFV